MLNRGDGQDVINDYDYRSYNRTDRVQFGAGISAEDLEVSRQGDDLLIVINDPTNPEAQDQVLIEQAFTDARFRIEQFEFADGTVLSGGDVFSRVTWTGTDGNDTMTGIGYNEVIHALGGDDTVNASGGNDTVYAGAGNDQVIAGDGNDVVYGETGDDTLTARYGNNLLDGGEGNDTLSMDRTGSYSTMDNYANTLIGGTGNDRLEGYNGADTYVLNRGGGQDVINDYDYRSYNRTDRVQFGAGISAEDLEVSRQGDDLLIVINDPTNPEAQDQVLIEQAFTDARFRIEQFEFADGTVLSGGDVFSRVTWTGTDGNDTMTGIGYNEVIHALGGDDTVNASGGNDTVYAGAGNDQVIAGDGNDVVYGETGDDTLTARYGNNLLDGGEGNDTLSMDRTGSYSTMDNYANTLIGGTGNDRLEGYNGADTYVLNRGGGQDVINDYDYRSYNRTDRVQFGAGISAEDLEVSRQGDDLLIVINDPTNPEAQDQVLIEQAFTDARFRIEQFEFADGTVLSGGDVFSRVTWTGTDGNDTMTGIGYNEVIHALGGDDTVNASGGNDTVYAGAGNDQVIAGDGNDVVYGETGDDTLTARYGNNLLDGGEGNDTLSMDRTGSYSTMDNYANTLIGGTGNDRLEGYNGADTYVLNRSDGQDVINDYDYRSYNRTDRVQFGAGISAEDLEVSRQGDDLLIVINDPTNPEAQDQVLIEQAFTDARFRIEQFEFADGTVLSGGDVFSRVTWTGTDGNDTMTGIGYNEVIHALGGDDTVNASGGDDVIYGGEGNDSLNGGSGSDTYVFGLNFGSDTVYNYDSSASSSDLARFDDASIEDLWFSRNDNHLQITEAGTNNQVVIDNWYSSTNYQLDSIETDASVLLNSQVDQLVSAMASYSVPSGAGNVIPQSVKDELQPVLAEAWQPT